MRTSYYGKSAVRSTAYSAALLTIALMLSYAESLLPPILPIAGMKLGLANIAVMLAFFISPAHAAAIDAGRVLITAMLFGSPVSFLMSASGALLSYFVLFAVAKLRIRIFSWIGVSVLSAAFHNAGQLAASMLITGNASVIGLLPPLMIAAALCGILTGAIMNRIAGVAESVLCGGYTRGIYGGF